jgi:UDP-N-acetylglucosamine acyltransferase
MIDKNAVVHPSAKVDEKAKISPFAVIGADVEIGAGTWIGPHTVIKGPARIGRDNKIFQFASVGEDPQDLKYNGETTFLEVGDRNVIREFCTIDRGTIQDKGKTVIGDDNLFMSYVHIAHDCCIGNHAIFANNATLAGHVHVDDHVIMGGFAAVYQFCYLGIHSFISAGALVTKDVLPFVKVAGVDSYAKPFGLNSVGLRRRGFDAKTRTMLKRAYKIIYRDGLICSEAIEKLRPMVKDCPEIDLFIKVLENAKHGIVR